MNHASSPCTDMAGHNYATCINVWIAKSVGCQSFWSNFTGIPVCSDIDQYNSYTSEYDRVIGMEKNELLATTGCLRPCKYMEYSVKRSIKHSSELLSSHLTLTCFSLLTPLSILWLPIRRTLR